MSEVESLLHVVGMTCGNCARHVGDALRGVPGVRQATVDLAAGTARVTHAPDTDLAALRAAIEDAGYELAAPA